MKYVIIGLGNYGRVLAEELSALGHEVIGADDNPHRVDAIKDQIATAFVLDATDELSLSVLPVNDVDVVIVAIGENLGASIRVIALLKQRKVKQIYARAIDRVHEAVLEAFDIQKILTPETDAARNLVQLLDLGVRVESFQVDDEYYVMKFMIPKRFVGYQISELNFDTEFHLKIIGLVRSHVVNNFIGISVLEQEVDNTPQKDYPMEEKDQLVCYGRYRDFQALWKAI